MTSNTRLAYDAVGKSILRHPGKPKLICVVSDPQKPYHKATKEQLEEWLEDHPDEVERTYYHPKYHLFLRTCGPFVYNEAWVRWMWQVIKKERTKGKRGQGAY